MMAPLMRRALVGAMGPQLLRGRRLASGKADPLSLDEEDEVEEPEPAATGGGEPEAEAEGEAAAEREARPRSVYTFGSKLNGRTGTNVRTNDLRLFPLSAQLPTRLDFFDNFDIVKVSGWYKHFLALTADGRVFAWGSNNYGQLGCGDESMMPRDRHAPVLVRTADGEPLQDIVEISAGKYHSAAVDKHGRVYTWGYGGRSMWLRPGHLLGYPATKGMYLKFHPWAQPIEDFGPEGGMDVETAENPFAEGKKLNPKAVKVACGSIHTVVLDAVGRAWTWGYGEWGRLGQDDSEDRTRPTPVMFFIDEHSGLPRIQLSDIAASESISSFVTPEGQVFMCGSDRARQLGFGAEEQGLRTARFEAVSTPHHVAGVVNAKTVAFGSRAALAVTKQGVPYYWGASETRGPQAYAAFGQRAKLKVKKVSAGSGPLFGDHRAFVTTDGQLFMNGLNMFGQALADTRPREGASALATMRKYLASWRATPLGQVRLDTQRPEFFADKYVVDVTCGNASTVVVAEELTEAELEERRELMEAVLEEYKELEERQSGKSGKKPRSNFGNKA